jgi:1A family penicillin-binding protein
MPVGKKRSRYSKQRYRTFSSPKRSQKKARRVTKKVGFSFSSLSPDNIKETVHNLFTTKEGWKVIGYIAVVFLGLIFAVFAWYARDLPSPSKINATITAQSTQIFDRNGNLLYEIHGNQNRIMASWDQIPQYAKDATIAIEDKNFYHEGGFSITGTARAILGLVTDNASLGGGSTITQQYVKNALLTDQRSISRKIKEIILSIEINQMYSKNDILKMYLNEIPYGSNAYGIDVAAKTYFNEDLSQLTLAQCATLAAMPQAPTYYSPYGDNKAALMTRKNLVLEKMAQQHYITEAQAKAAENQVLVFSNNPYGSITAPHFVMYVRQQLVDMYGENMVDNGGLKVYTTLDLTKQNEAQASVTNNVAKNQGIYGDSNASLMSIDPKTGQILAMVGSANFFDDSIDGNVNVAEMERQPGSSFKPFVYATAWETPTWGPGSVLYDLKTDFGGGYSPNDYTGTFMGPVTMREALDDSLNVPAVKTLYIAGIGNSLATAKAMGITSLGNASQYGLSLVLGTGEVTLAQMTSAYGVFADGGILQTPTWYLKIEDSKGKTLAQYKPSAGKRVLDPQIAYLMSNVLSDDAARAKVFGLGGPLTLPNRPVAAKTGTTENYVDAWTLGYTPSLVTGVWAGNDDGTPMTEAGGAIAAAPIWHDYMETALAGTPVEQFVKPSGIKTVTLDSVTGRQPSSGEPTETDVFPSWFNLSSVPNGTTSYQVDTQTGKLVNSSCPPSANLISTVGSNAVTAEIPFSDPAYSNWFAPIASWASAHGYPTSSSGSSLGTDTCPLEQNNTQTSQGNPSIDFNTPVDGDSVSPTFTVQIAATAPNGVQSVTVSYGSQTTQATLNGSFYTAQINATQAGSLSLTATVTDSQGLTASKQITVHVM